MDHQPKSCKVAASLYQVFKVVLSMYYKWITKAKVIKLLGLYIKCLNLRCLLSRVVHQPKVEMLRNLYIKWFKLRCLCIKSG